MSELSNTPDLVNDLRFEDSPSEPAVFQDILNYDLNRLDPRRTRADYRANIARNGGEVLPYDMKMFDSGRFGMVNHAGNRAKLGKIESGKINSVTKKNRVPAQADILVVDDETGVAVCKTTSDSEGNFVIDEYLSRDRKYTILAIDQNGVLNTSALSHVTPGPNPAPADPFVPFEITAVSDINSSGGEVIINGTNFDEGASVTLDGSPATDVIVIRSSLIWCVAPAGTIGSTVDVVVTNEDSETSTSTADYVRNVTIDSVTPNEDQSGSSVTITGTGFEGAAATVTFDGVAATSIVTVSSTEITCDVPSVTIGTNANVVVTVDGQTATLIEGFKFIGTYSIVDSYWVDLESTYTLTDNQTVLCDANSTASYFILDNPKSSGKYYVEFALGGDTSETYGVGLARSGPADAGVVSGWIGNFAEWAIWNDGDFYENGNQTTSANTYANGDVVMMAVDLDARKVWFGINGTWVDSGDPAAGTGEQFSIDADGDTPLEQYAFAPAASPYSFNSEVTIHADPVGHAYSTPVGFVSGWPY